MSVSAGPQANNGGLTYRAASNVFARYQVQHIRKVLLDILHFFHRLLLMQPLYQLGKLGNGREELHDAMCRDDCLPVLQVCGADQ